ncbi:MAG: hypothetical protein LBQ00_04175 [Syntrophobacterales bacterium]|jgi:hypothetical protein|nr:hypothetical protein [Syntrophobacterales bacterium]
MAEVKISKGLATVSLNKEGVVSMVMDKAVFVEAIKKFFYCVPCCKLISCPNLMNICPPVLCDHGCFFAKPGDCYHIGLPDGKIVQDQDRNKISLNKEDMLEMAKSGILTPEDLAIIAVEIRDSLLTRG